MSNYQNQSHGEDKVLIYRFRIKGHIGDHGATWFGEGFTSEEKNGNTIIVGPVADQAALYGIMKKIRDLGISLISVNCIDDNEEKVKKHKEK